MRPDMGAFGFVLGCRLLLLLAVVAAAAAVTSAAVAATSAVGLLEGSTLVPVALVVLVAFTERDEDSKESEEGSR